MRQTAKTTVIAVSFPSVRRWE